MDGFINSIWNLLSKKKSLIELSFFNYIDCVFEIGVNFNKKEIFSYCGSRQNMSNVFQKTSGSDFESVIIVCDNYRDQVIIFL